MDIVVLPPGRIQWRACQKRCALGRNGVSTQKTEGDLATPIGVFPLRRVMYRADRLKLPKIKLQALEITPALGWCDDPSDPSYNRLVRLPFLARHEKLWRDDGLYDLIAELGYNDDPAVAGKGSAIFMHVAANDYQPTAGCIALARHDLVQMLCECEGNDRLIVNP